MTCEKASSLGLSGFTDAYITVQLITLNKGNKVLGAFYLSTQIKDCYY